MCVQRTQASLGVSAFLRKCTSSTDERASARRIYLQAMTSEGLLELVGTLDSLAEDMSLGRVNVA